MIMWHHRFKPSSDLLRFNDASAGFCCRNNVNSQIELFPLFLIRLFLSLLSSTSLNSLPAWTCAVHIVQFHTSLFILPLKGHSAKINFFVCDIAEADFFSPWTLFCSVWHVAHMIGALKLFNPGTDLSRSTLQHHRECDSKMLNCIFNFFFNKES